MLELFAHIPLFQSLEPVQIELLKPLFEDFSCPAETSIFAQGAPAIHLYLIVKGIVQIQYKPYDGPPIKITHLSSGDAFGWSAVVGSPHYTSTAISVSDVEAIRIRGVDLRNLVSRHPDDGRVILNQLALIVSSRWQNAQSQVQSILEKGL